MKVFNLLLTFEDGSTMPYVYSSYDLAIEAQEISCELYEDVVEWTLVENEMNHEFKPSVVH